MNKHSDNLILIISLVSVPVTIWLCLKFAILWLGVLFVFGLASALVIRSRKLRIDIKRSILKACLFSCIGASIFMSRKWDDVKNETIHVFVKGFIQERKVLEQTDEGQSFYENRKFFILENKYDQDKYQFVLWVMTCVIFGSFFITYKHYALIESDSYENNNQYNY